MNIGYRKGRNGLNRFIAVILFVLVTACGEIELVAPPIDDTHGADATTDALSTDTNVPIDATETPDTTVPIDTQQPVDTGLVEGGFGYPCSDNDDCNSGFCVPTSQGLVCTETCESECPDNWVCRAVGSGGDVTFICLEEHINLCRPCLATVDCTGALGEVALASRCIQYEDQGWFCGHACAEGECPSGYSCQEVTDKEGDVSSQCVADSGQCSCSPYATALGAETWCAVANEFGTCKGKTKCSDSGLSPCDAAVPEEEVCDLVDNDCDDAIDEDIEPALCTGEANEFGTCEGTATCEEGEMVCDAGVASQEICDGIDNNCSGVADDGETDTDEDGAADCVDDDDDGDGSPDADDNCPLVANQDQLDTDADGAGDACDDDDDGDGVSDDDDSAPLDPNLCGVDADADTCDDCASGTNDPKSDGTDTDTDGLCDLGDPDDDNDGCLDADDDAPLVSSSDADKDGTADDCDSDDDNDGVSDDDDSAPLDPNLCGVDADADTCDDCASGTNDPKSDGTDTDNDGLCDLGDPDDDNDGSLDEDDSDDADPALCSDTDQDGCDDCVSGTFNPKDDGVDTDGDGLCDAGDQDDDNDGLNDDVDCEPLLAIPCVQPSCADFKQALPGAKSGIYTIDPDGEDGPIKPFDAYCDQTTDGGGWTLLLMSRTHKKVGQVASFSVEPNFNTWTGKAHNAQIVDPTTNLDEEVVTPAIEHVPFTEIRFESLNLNLVPSGEASVYAHGDNTVWAEKSGTLKHLSGAWPFDGCEGKFGGPVQFNQSTTFNDPGTSCVAKAKLGCTAGNSSWPNSETIGVAFFGNHNYFLVGENTTQEGLFGFKRHRETGAHFVANIWIR